MLALGNLVAAVEAPNAPLIESLAGERLDTGHTTLNTWPFALVYSARIEATVRTASVASASTVLHLGRHCSLIERVGGTQTVQPETASDVLMIWCLYSSADTWNTGTPLYNT